MSKRALLCGCNYPGTNNSLRGCVNDVTTMINILTTKLGFPSENIVVMIDTDPSKPQPTGKNIKDKLSELVKASAPGDILFFHFSGHGTQVPSDQEDDGKNEAIVPTDMNLICDDDLRVILVDLQDGVKFTMIADCCHSGTLLDHKEVIITGPKPGSAPPPALNVGALAGLFGLKELQAPDAVKNRALPFANLTETLTQLLGQQVEKGNVRAALGQLYGKDASRSVNNYLAVAAQLLSNPNALNDLKANPVKGIMGILTACFKGGGADNTSAGGTTTTVGGPGEPTFNVTLPPAGQKPPPGGVNTKGVLITGCQSMETSADACPSGDANKAYGALTNGISTVLEAHYQQNPGQPITYRNLVVGVRDALGKGGFTQNPCLECQEANADTPFIVA